MLIDEAGVMSYQFDYFQSAGLSQVSCKIIHETAQKTSIRVQRKFCIYHLSSKNMWKDLLNWRKRHFSISFIFPIRRKKTQHAHSRIKWKAYEISDDTYFMCLLRIVSYKASHCTKYSWGKSYTCSEIKIPHNSFSNGLQWNCIFLLEPDQTAEHKAQFC